MISDYCGGYYNMLKTPEDFTIPEWTQYIKEAFKRETDKNPNPFIHEILYPRLWVLVEKDVFDSYMAAIRFDLLALENADEKTMYEQTYPSTMIKPFFDRPRSRTFWRGVWFSRFAKEEQQVNFYRYWLRQYEFSFERIDYGKERQDLIIRCKTALQKAEDKIRKTNPDASFTLNWIKENMSEQS